MTTRLYIAPLGCFRFALMVQRDSRAPPAMLATGPLDECRSALAALARPRCAPRCRRFADDSTERHPVAPAA